jgi:hypothetical protein
MLGVTIDGSGVRVGERLVVTFQRTLRVPDSGGPYPLPPGLGVFPVYPASELAGRTALPGVKPGDAVIPMYQREALWLGFGGTPWKPNAVQVGAGDVNAVSGGPFSGGLSDAPQNYLVFPQQPWLDGINVAAGQIRQFVALPLEDPRTIEAQLRGQATPAGLRLRVFEPHPGRFPEQAPLERGGPQRAAGAMGLGAGGRIAQRVIADPFGLGTWDPGSAREVPIHLVDSRTFAALTSRPAPPTPIYAATYAKHGLPWFARFDEDVPAAAPSPELAGVTPTAGEDETEAPVEVDPATVAPTRPRR